MEKIYSVSEFNRMVKSYIDDIDDFQEFFIEGEISNITYYKSGHLYFSIKDSKSQIKCAAFNYKLKRIPEDLKEGDLIKLFGDVGFYHLKPLYVSSPFSTDKPSRGKFALLSKSYFVLRISSSCAVISAYLP